MSPLEQNIQKFHEGLKNHCPLFTNAREGKLTAKEPGAYARNILFLIRYTPIYLTLAAKKSREAGFHEFAMFYDDKLKEEVGHDQWAESDVQSLAVGSAGDINPHMAALISFLGDQIHRDPRLYLAYIFFAEYLTVIAGPEWLDDLDRFCGIKRESISVVNNHVELDKEHVHEDLQAISSLIGPSLMPAMLDVLRESQRHYLSFCHDVGTPSP